MGFSSVPIVGPTLTTTLLLGGQRRPDPEIQVAPSSHVPPSHLALMVSGRVVGGWVASMLYSVPARVGWSHIAPLGAEREWGGDRPTQVPQLENDHPRVAPLISTVPSVYNLCDLLA